MKIVPCTTQKTKWANPSNWNNNTKSSSKKQPNNDSDHDNNKTKTNKTKQKMKDKEISDNVTKRQTNDPSNKQTNANIMRTNTQH